MYDIHTYTKTSLTVVDNAQITTPTLALELDRAMGQGTGLKVALVGTKTAAAKRRKTNHITCSYYHRGHLQSL